MTCDLDSISLEVYLELNLIEARAAAILTHIQCRTRLRCFWSSFLFPPTCSWFILMIRAGENNWVPNKPFEDKLLRQVLFPVETPLAASGFAWLRRRMGVFGRMGVFDR